MEFHNVAQNTDEWFSLRAGKLTSSSMSKVMANLGKAFGEPAKQLAVNIAVEQITGNPTGGGHTNEHMERGHAQEPIARMLYEQEHLTSVSNGGFFDCDFQGCSPDGLVGAVGVIEIKSSIPSVHYSRVRRQGLDPAHKWQCISNLILTGREWLDFVSYCSEFPEGKQLYVFRLHKAAIAEERTQLNQRVAEFRALVDESKKLIETSEYSLLGEAQ